MRQSGIACYANDAFPATSFLQINRLYSLSNWKIRIRDCQLCNSTNKILVQSKARVWMKWDYREETAVFWNGLPHPGHSLHIA